MAYVELVGAEVEGWHMALDGTPKLLIMTELDGLNERLTSTGFVTTEPGPGSIELVGLPAASVREAVRHVLEVQRALAVAGIVPRFVARSPWAGTTSGLNANTPRLLALVAAALRESGLDEVTHGRLFSSLNYWAATHMHASGSFIVDTKSVGDDAVFLANVVNLIGPFVAHELCRKHGIARDPGHLAIYRGWAQAARFPHWGLWHPNGRAYIEAFESLLRLVRPVGKLAGKTGGEWEPDLVTKAKWGNPADDGSIWWPYCRLRPKYGTAELRFMPSCPLDRLEVVVSDLVMFVEIVLDSFQGPIESQRAFLSHSSWRDVRVRIGSELGIVLPQLITEQSWLAAQAA